MSENEKTITFEFEGSRYTVSRYYAEKHEKAILPDGRTVSLSSYSVAVADGAVTYHPRLLEGNWREVTIPQARFA